MKQVTQDMKEMEPRALYLHCYGHGLNLDVADTLKHVKPLQGKIHGFSSGPMKAWLVHAPRMNEQDKVEPLPVTKTTKSLQLNTVQAVEIPWN